MISILKKITIGSAQLGLKYGTYIKRKKISINDFKKILNLSKKKKIQYIDTAVSYGDSEKKIGRCLAKKKNKFKIITKLPSLKKIKKNNLEKKIYDYVKLSQYRTKSNIHTLLIHSAEDLISKNKKEIFNIINNLKKRGVIKYIGFSAYNKKDVILILKKFKFDVIQFPFNLFDQRLIEKEFFKFLKKKKIKIHIRSIFLQGLLLNVNNNYKIISNNKKKFNQWDNFLKKNKLKPLEACFLFVSKYNFYSNIVIGFDSFKQFKELVFYAKSMSNKKKINFKLLESNNSNLINPSRWKQ